MKKYKLIKKYPGSPVLNTIITIESSQETGYYSDNKEFWEEIIEKDYEILSFKTPKNTILMIGKTNQGWYTGVLEVGNNDFRDEEWMLKHGYLIESIKRLSDGEVFTIGDKINGISYKNITINSIDLNPNCSQIMFNKLDEGIDLINAVKSKPVLFTTEDEVDIYEGDIVYGIHISYSHVFSCDDLLQAKKENWKKFSSKKAAEDYLILNKPCLSINDVNNCYTSPKSSPLHNNLINNLKKLVKSKLNNKKEIW